MLLSEIAARREKKVEILGVERSFLPHLDDLFSAWQCFDPYNFWHYERYTWYYSTGVLSLNFSWKTDFREESRLLRDLQEFLASFGLEELPEVEKIKAVHDLIVVNVHYDWNALGTFYELYYQQRGLCLSYSLAAQKAFELLGIKSVIVSGYNNSGIKHVWNMVNLCCGDDCKWFHLDVTWDDPYPDNSGKILYRYFLLSDQEIEQDHSISNACQLRAPLSFSAWSAECKKKGLDIYSPGVYLILSLKGYDHDNFVRKGQLLTLHFGAKLFELKEIFEEMELYLKAETPEGPFWYTSEGWQPLEVPYYGGIPEDLEKSLVVDTSSLPKGPYILYFRLDLRTNNETDRHIFSTKRLDFNLF